MLNPVEGHAPDTNLLKPIQKDTVGDGVEGC